MSILLMGFLGSLAAGLMTGVGALPVLFGRNITRYWNDVLLGFAAGVMLSASFFSLILPGIGHVPHREAEEVLVEAIAGFLSLLLPTGEKVPAGG